MCWYIKQNEAILSYVSPFDSGNTTRSKHKYSRLFWEYHQVYTQIFQVILGIPPGPYTNIPGDSGNTTRSKH